MDIKLIFTVLTLHFLALIMPGPDFFLTMRNTLQFGRKMGLATAIGFGLGIAVHVSYCLVGVNLLLNNYPYAFQVVKILGGIYLCYLGASTMWGVFNSPSPVGVAISSSAPSRQSFTVSLQQGLLTNLLNPKATLFILGLFTSIIPSSASFISITLTGLGMVLMTIAWFALVAFFFGSLLVRQYYLGLQTALNVIFGFFFLLAGLLLLLRD